MRSLRTALIALGLVGLAGGLVAIAILVGDYNEEDRGAVLILGPLIGWSFIGTGLFAWWRRPENRFGALMTAVGFVWMLGALGSSDTPEIFIIGLLFGPLAYALLLHMLVAFPSGQLRTRWERFLVGVAYFDTTLVTLVAVLFHQTSGTDEFCEDCPANPILISDQPGFSDFVFGLQSVLGALALAAIAVLLVRRWRRSAASYRRAVTPVLIAGIATAALLGISLLANVSGGPRARARM